MDELRVVRRDEESLIVSTESGDEFRLVVDESALAEFRYLTRPARGLGKVNPREIQAMVRMGKTRAEISAATGLEESDIERYEEPVLAERRYILDLAHAVAVRTSSAEGSEDRFGAVIAERLTGLSATQAEWRSWRDEESGWMIGLDFESHDVAHHAVWSFEHRKGILTPITPDATTLSKQGDVGDRLIPKLRAVDKNERFDSGAFDVDALRDTEGDVEPETGSDADEDSDDAPKSTSRTDANDAARRPSGRVSPDHPSTGSIPVVDAGDDFIRRQQIEERAIKTSETELPDLGQTADLLDALRRRRGEREATAGGPESTDEDREPSNPIPISGGAGSRGNEPVGDDDPETEHRWEIVEDEPQDAPDADSDDVDETRIVPRPGPYLVTDASSDSERDDSTDGAFSVSTDGAIDDEPSGNERRKHAEDAESGRKPRGRRASIPSWDDILFGTRSEDDPA